MTGKEKDGKEFLLSFRLDMKKTKLLIENPVPAAQVRPHIPSPRGAVVNIEQGMRAIRKLLPWRCLAPGSMRERVEMAQRSFPISRWESTSVSVSKTSRSFYVQEGVEYTE